MLNYWRSRLNGTFCYKSKIWVLNFKSIRCVIYQQRRYIFGVLHFAVYLILIGVGDGSMVIVNRLVPDLYEMYSVARFCYIWFVDLVGITLSHPVSCISGIKIKWYLFSMIKSNHHVIDGSFFIIRLRYRLVFSVDNDWILNLLFNHKKL